MTHTAYLALGTNLGDKEGNIREAYRLIGQHVGTIRRQSTPYHSKPWGFTSENDFINTVICCDTPLSPKELLTTLQRIEKTMGRAEKSKNREYHDRIIDIDILLYDDITVEEPDLIIPHPLMKERPFVMIPLEEVLEDEQNKTRTIH